MAATAAWAQVTDTASMGAGYMYQTYYSMANGTVLQQTRDSWDLQFVANIFSASVRVNSAAGAQLYEPLNSDTTNWSTLDTSGMQPVYDRDTSWEESAFNANATGHPDYGWGYYTGSGNLTGKKIFVIKLVDGSFRKIWIRGLAFGDTYTIEVANLDGSNDTTFQVKKTDYTGKSFFYYDLRGMQVLDLDPPAENWDLVFTKYSAQVAPGMYYPVTGVLSNAEVEVAEARGVDINAVDYTMYPFQTDISAIGYDWKSFNMNNFQYEVEDSLVFWVRGRDSGIYRLVFTAFGGSADGNFVFTKQFVAQTGLEDIQTPVVATDLYPNPARGQFTLMLDLNQPMANTRAGLLDMIGRIVKTWQTGNLPSGLQSLRFSLPDLAPGMYLLQFGNDAFTINKRIIVR